MLKISFNFLVDFILSMVITFGATVFVAGSAYVLGAGCLGPFVSGDVTDWKSPFFHPALLLKLRSAT